ncbi:hypothetical protein K1719_038673 [Acacia pycnantha]|nr:hypothetical protein K1719_038673 [Acacia pycnantha]
MFVFWLFNEVKVKGFDAKLDGIFNWAKASYHVTTSRISCFSTEKKTPDSKVLGGLSAIKEACRGEQIQIDAVATREKVAPPPRNKRKR